MVETLATESGKKFALKALKKRREENSKKEKIDNSSLYAGLLMYYYCINCGSLADKLPEAHACAPKELCDECQALKDLGWLE